MVRTTLSTLVMAAGIVAAGTAPAYAEEVCVQGGVTQDGAPLVESPDEACVESGIPTNETRYCTTEQEGFVVCVVVTTP